MYSRRELLKSCSALAAVGTTMGVAGCSSLPVIGGGGGGSYDHANWFYPGDEITAGDHYSFRTFAPITITENEDAFDEEVFELYEDSFETRYDPLGLDFDEVEVATSFDNGAASVLSGYEPSREEVVEELEDADFDDDEEVGGLQLYVGPEESVAVGVGDDDLVVGRSVRVGGDPDNVRRGGETGTRADLRSISYGESWTGEIDDSDPSDGDFQGTHEPVTFQGTAGDVVTINMASEGDTFLYLLDPNDEVVVADDDGGEGYNSMIAEYELQSTGEYTIIATSYSTNATFEYDLTLTLISQELDPTEIVTAAAEANDSEEERYTADSDAMSDLVDALGDGAFVTGWTHEEYDQSIPERGVFETAVARGATYTVNGEESDVLWAAVLEDAEAVDEDDLEDWADEGVLEDVDDVSVEVGDRVATVEGVIDTDDITFNV